MMLASFHRSLVVVTHLIKFLIKTMIFVSMMVIQTSSLKLIVGGTLFCLSFMWFLAMHHNVLLC